MNEKDIEYLDEQFPKGKTKFRGEAMVLLALARKHGEEKRNVEVKKAMDDIRIYTNEFGRTLLAIYKKELLQKLGLGELD